MVQTGTPGVVAAEGLVKVYKARKSEVRAQDGLDPTVAEGSVLGLLGPNGAGKTTTVRILATLLKPDAGRATVAGFDVVRQAQELRAVSGRSGRYAAGDEDTTGREHLAMSRAGVFMGLSVRTVAGANQVGFTGPFPATSLSNVFVPTESLPAWLEPVAVRNPVSALTAACRDLGGNPNPYAADRFPAVHPALMTLGWTVLIVAIFAPIGVRRHRSMSGEAYGPPTAGPALASRAGRMGPAVPGDPVSPNPARSHRRPLPPAAISPPGPAWSTYSWTASAEGPYLGPIPSQNASTIAAWQAIL